MDQPAVRRKRRWYRLDNAAKIYPAIRTRRWNALFRLTVTLNEPVDPERLTRALNRTLKRCPHMRCRLRRGLFWYYLEENPRRPVVTSDVVNPFVPINARQNRGFLFRLRYHDCRVAIEVFHALADGTGLLVFLKTLAAEYLRQQGIAIPATDGVLDGGEKPKTAELEDSYNRYADASIRGSRKENPAWHLKGARTPRFRPVLTTGLMEVAPFLTLCKEKQVTVTEMLTAVYLYAMLEVQRATDPKARREIKISVPVNMRAFYPSETLRNFSLFINVGMDPSLGPYTLDETLNYVMHTFRRDITKKKMSAMMAANVRDERNPWMRAFPLFLKKPALALAYHMLGENQFSSTLSNLGVVKLPEEMRPYVSRFDFVLGTPLKTGISAGVISYDGQMVISFTRDMADARVERAFFTTLVKMGLRVKVEGDR